MKIIYIFMRKLPFLIWIYCWTINKHETLYRHSIVLNMCDFIHKLF